VSIESVREPDQRSADETRRRPSRLRVVAEPEPGPPPAQRWPHAPGSVGSARDYVVAVERAAGRRAAISEETDHYLSGFAKGTVAAGHSITTSFPATPSEVRHPVECDAWEAVVARSCLLVVVPIVLCMRALARPGWLTDVLSTGVSTVGFVITAALAVMGSVWTCHVTSPPFRLFHQRSALDGRVAVVTLVPFFACLLPATVLLLVI